MKNAPVADAFAGIKDGAVQGDRRLADQGADPTGAVRLLPAELLRSQQRPAAGPVHPAGGAGLPVAGALADGAGVPLLGHRLGRTLGHLQRGRPEQLPAVAGRRQRLHHRGGQLVPIHPGRRDRADGPVAGAGPGPAAEHPHQRVPARPVLLPHRAVVRLPRLHLVVRLRPDVRPGRLDPGDPRPGRLAATAAGRPVAGDLLPGGRADLVPRGADDGRVHRRPADHPAGAERGGRSGRRHPLATLPLHHLATHRAGHRHRRRLHHHPVLQGVRPDLRQHRRRAQPRDRDPLDPDLQLGVPERRIRLRRSPVGDLRDGHRDGHRAGHVPAAAGG